MENTVLFLWDSWSILGRVVALLAIVTFALGLETLAVKLFADIYNWRGRRAEPTVEMLRRKQEGRAAILIPITGPAPLAGSMLARLRRTIDYGNYVIFVGVRAIDAQTVAAIRREARTDDRIQLCLYDLHDAANPARARNLLVGEARRFEHGQDDEFKSFVLLGPDTAVHPLSLKLLNWHSEFASVVQLPLLTVSRGGLPMTGGAGLDDLGEHHAGETLLRAKTVHSVPVRDTGLALRRDAMWALKRQGDVFDTGSESPVFDAVRKLGERGHLATFAWQRDDDAAVIAVEELSPRSHADAVRAESQRLSVTALSRWNPLGSPQCSFWAHYFNFRDRRIVIVAATMGCAFLCAIAAAALLIAGHFTPGFEEMPALIESPWVIALLAINAGLAGAALFERMVQTARTRGLAAAAVLPLNLAASGLIAARAVLRASRSDTQPAPASKRLPGAGTMPLAGSPRITDILVHSGALTGDGAKIARAYSRRTGRRLSLALQDLRLVDGTEVARAIGERQGMPFGHVDGPLDSYCSVFLSLHEAERFCAFAQRAEDGGVDVYIGEEYSVLEWRALRAALRRAGVHRPHFIAAPLAEVAYAIRFAGTAQEMAIEQTIAVSLMDGPIIEGTERAIRRQLRAPYRRLEDLLVERGLIRPRRLQLVRRRILDTRSGLQDVVRDDRRIPPFTLAETVREFNEWRPAIAPLNPVTPSARFDSQAGGAYRPRLAA